VQGCFNSSSTGNLPGRGNFMANDISRQVRRAAERAARRRSPSKPRLPFDWRDAIALLAIPFAVMAILSENNAIVATCFVVSWGIVCAPIIWHPEIRREYRLSYCVLIGLLCAALFILIKSENLAKELARNEGVLEPAHDVVPVPDCAPPHTNPVALHMGPAKILIGGFPRNIFRIANQEILTLGQERSGNIKIMLLRIYDDRNNIIARIDGNAFWIGTGIRKKHPDRSTLKIYDHNDDEVLNIRYQNPHAVSILGIFRYLGRMVMVTPTIMQVGGIRDHGSCAVESPSGIVRVD
jgi:hypothetical protein